MAGRTGRIGIDDVSPVISAGQYPAKAVVGELVDFSAAVWREGHDAVAATLVLTRSGSPQVIRIPMSMTGEDRFGASFRPDAVDRWTFKIEGWGDPITTWLAHVTAIVEFHYQHGWQDDAVWLDLHNYIAEGADLLHRASRIALRGGDKIAADALKRNAAVLHDSAQPIGERLAHVLAADSRNLLQRYPIREFVTSSRSFALAVQRRRALVGAWYELFPRSTGGWDEHGNPVHGTFATAAAELPRIAAMHFDVIYLPPIHPIGVAFRKGKNNSLTATADDVGSPWAIGSIDGGHDAIHPQLGTAADFRSFIESAHSFGLEVAMDLAFQTSPDHPYVEAYPQWFTVRADGSIAYAQNPPKKYQDIYPLNFDRDKDGIYAELLRVTEYWIALGVKVFRVDNPHTKPPNFWEWLIAKVNAQHPDVIFLAEAFTRSARLYGLAKLGFSQSYTYFTWQTSKDQLTEFATTIAHNTRVSRPNLFVNTPDILHASLQFGGPAMFAIRAVLAATLAPSWGVYSGFELFEHQAVAPGSEEYLDSEKYQLRPRDYHGARLAGRSLEPWITQLNMLRQQHISLQQLANIHFHHVDNPAIIAFSKRDSATDGRVDIVLIVVVLDSFNVQEGTLYLDLGSFGYPYDGHFDGFDEVTGQTFNWSAANYVRLDPLEHVAHIVTIEAGSAYQ